MTVRANQDELFLPKYPREVQYIGERRSAKTGQTPVWDHDSDFDKTMMFL